MQGLKRANVGAQRRDSEGVLNLPSESWAVRTGDFYSNDLIIPRKERPREGEMSLLQPYSS